MLFNCPLICFKQSSFSNNSFRNTSTVSNKFDPDQACQFVEPDLSQNCLQKLSADDTRRQKVNQRPVYMYVRVMFEYYIEWHLFHQVIAFIYE